MEGATTDDAAFDETVVFLERDRPSTFGTPLLVPELLGFILSGHQKISQRLRFDWLGFSVLAMGIGSLQLKNSCE